MNKINKHVIGIFVIGIFILGCGEDRANSSGKNGGVLGVVAGANDRDGDGLSNSDEVNVYFTNPDNNDTDGDGLFDGEEITQYDTNATNPDTDGDNLLDGAEVHHATDASNPLKKDTDGDGLQDDIEVEVGYVEMGRDTVLASELNATNPDTDGDCLLDRHEVVTYRTHPNDTDTDKDGVADGLEIYSMIPGIINTSCVDSPESNTTDAKTPQANDNIPIGNLIINALNPKNDSDGDGWANIKELTCTGGNPEVNASRCPSINDGPLGEAMGNYGYAFVPGGFDVDGDGIDEGGFWTSIYQATDKDSNSREISEAEVVTIAQLDNSYNKFLVDNFEVLNEDSPLRGYAPSTLNANLTVPEGDTLTFKTADILDANDNRLATKPRYVSVKAFMAVVSLKKVTFGDTDQNDLNISIGMLSNKQYSHILQLLKKDKEINGANNNVYVPIVRNGLLGVDVNVPLSNYSLSIKEFNSQKKEYVHNAIHIMSTTNAACHKTPCFEGSRDIPLWWGVTENNVTVPLTGDGAKSASTFDEGGTISGDTDPYAIMVRGREVLDLRHGVASAGNGDEVGGNAIGFRAATPYLY